MHLDDIPHTAASLERAHSILVWLVDGLLLWKLLFLRRLIRHDLPHQRHRRHMSHQRWPGALLECRKEVLSVCCMSVGLPAGYPARDKFMKH
jgi:hypothetical protein